MKVFYSIILFLSVFLLNISGQEPDEEERPVENQQPKKASYDSIKLNITVKRLRSDLLSYDSIPFDTLLEDIHLQHQLKRDYTFVSHLGNYGLAAVPVNYYMQPSTSGDLFFLDAVNYNFIHKENILYFKTNHPFSNISYNATAAKNVDLQSLRFIHTQNITKKFNVGTYLNLHSSNGLYQNQKSTANAISLFSNYEGDYYSMNVVVSYNTLKNQENGGIANDSIFENESEKGAVYPTVFQDANTNIRNGYIFLNQRFNLAGLREVVNKARNDSSVRKFSGIGLLHTMELSRNKRSYTDNQGPSEIVPYTFYSMYNNDRDSTRDSLYFFRLRNSLELLLGKQNPNEPPILIRAGLKSVYDKYRYTEKFDSTFIPLENSKFDTVLNARFYNNHYHNVAFTGGISIGIKSFFLLNANADYFFTGYKAGDLFIHGKLTNRLSKKPGSLSLNILMDISRYKPGYFYDRYYSNHFNWSNSFIPVKEIRTGLQINWPAIKFDADFNYTLLSAPVFFDSLAMPQQINSEMSVLESSVSKSFKAGAFHTKFLAMLQLTSNDRVIPLPLFSGYNSSYVEMKFFKVLTTQLGYDLRFNTEYYAHAFMPDLGVFYNQQQKKIGNYPYVDVFLNVKLKRMRFYLKFEHVNSDLLSRNYYTVLHYPVNSRMLTYGLSWNFYD